LRHTIVVMSELPEPDEPPFRLATGEELVLPGDTVPAVAGRRASMAPTNGPVRPARPSLLDRRAAQRLRARKVRRLVRHVEPWSVLKLSLIFYFCLWIITLISGVILWNMAVSSGTIDNVENFIEELFALESFDFNGDQIFRAAAVGGLVLVVAGSGFTVLMAVLFNLISDITGGVRLTVVEEETARPRPRRTRPRRGVMPTPASELRPVAVPEGMTRVPETDVRVGSDRAPEAPDQRQDAVMTDPKGRVASADSDPTGLVESVDSDPSDGDVSEPPEPQAQVATSPPDR
jgi:hypothetical protein